MFFHQIARSHHIVYSAREWVLRVDAKIKRNTPPVICQFYRKAAHTVYSAANVCICRNNISYTHIVSHLYTFAQINCTHLYDIYRSKIGAGNNWNCGCPKVSPSAILLFCGGCERERYTRNAGFFFIDSLITVSKKKKRDFQLALARIRVSNICYAHTHDGIFFFFFW